MTANYQTEIFKQSVDDALKAVERILDVSRNPRLAGDVEHVYSDKYSLTNSMTNVAIIAQMNVFERLGLTKDILQKIDTTKATTLRFQASTTCEFLTESIVEVAQPTTIDSTEATETTGSFRGSTTKSTINKVVNRVQEFHWKVGVNWEVFLYSGSDTDKRQVLCKRNATTTIVTQSAKKNPPLSKHDEHTPVDLSLTWLLNQIDTKNITSHFSIDTQNAGTRTPRRNEQVEKAIAFMSEIQTWMLHVEKYFRRNIQHRIIDRHNPAKPDPATSPVGVGDLSNLRIFVPILPLMDDTDAEESPQGSCSEAKSVLTFMSMTAEGETGFRVLSNNDMSKLLNYQIQTIDDAHTTVQKVYISNGLVSSVEGFLCVLCRHSLDLWVKWQESIDYVEAMLHEQLVAAIGKFVSSDDLDQFVKYHNAKILRPSPLPFCLAIRRPEHFPEGILAIEHAGTTTEPIETHVREIHGVSSVKCPLNAATTVEFTGRTFLHGWLNHRFVGSSNSFHLVGRARQFSSFMLIIGTMATSERMEPKDAIILQNKDEVKIPLLLNEIPTAKEFRDAISSLSPEQQHFAKAYRSMQLESSVIGVCVVQIKPQLEKLLNLPHDALNKEMKLTEDLMSLQEYQIPSQMLSYEGEDELTTPEKVAKCKEHVKAVLDVIEEIKKKTLDAQAMETDMAVEQRIATGQSFGANLQRREAYQPSRSLFGVSSAFGAPAGGFGNTPNQEMHQTFNAFGKRRQAEPFEFGTSTRRVQAEALICDAASEGQLADACIPMAKSSKEASLEEASPPESSDIHSMSTHNAQIDGGDFTHIPKALDHAIDQYCSEVTLRSTKIKLADSWTRERQENLLSKATTTILNQDDIKSEKNKAFDLLDALSRSGSLPIPHSELHVVVCLTHVFDKDVMKTVIQDNINPIEKLELSTLLLAATVHCSSVEKLISKDEERKRLIASFPSLVQIPKSEEENP